MARSPVPVKYFFLTVGWEVSRVWEFGGLWDESVWQRSPQIQQINVAIIEQGEQFWLYQVEDAVLMVEVQPDASHTSSNSAIGKVLLKRLMSAEQVLDRLQKADSLLNSQAPSSPP